MEKFRPLFFLLVFTAFMISCGEDDEPEVFDAPTIAVTVDNDQPFQGDQINFNINVSAPGGLSGVTLNGSSIKTYSANETSDTFTYTFDIAEDATVGPTNFVFEVSDMQGTPMMASSTSAITIQNSDFRGSPTMLADFQDAIPNANIQGVTFDSGPNSWEAAYSIETQAEDPENSANSALRANRLGATDWYFNGGGAIFIQFDGFLNEEEMEAVFSGDRVLQMNIYMNETERLATLHNNPDDPGNNTLEYDLSWGLDRFYTEADEALNGWNYDQQDSVPAIPIRLEIGNQASWAWNNGDPLGKKFYLVGSITETGGWQTVTFSPMMNSGTTEEPFLIPKEAGSSEMTYEDDQNVGFDQIDYFAIILNNRVTTFPNVDGYYEMPGDGNGWSSDVVATISDNHNEYYIDNIRIIDADVYDQNPNE